jgi:glycosyltransferase involved in cell wall biosynthesis
MSIQISVVVPTCRRPDLLERCLAALLAQEFDPAAYEIIVADDAACDETRALVERWAARAQEQVLQVPPARLLAHEVGQDVLVERAPLVVAEEPGPRVRYLPVIYRHGPAAARNAGWRAARGAIIAFTDDDCIPTPGWLSAGAAAFAAGAAAVDGQIVVPLPDAPTDYERDAAGLMVAEFATANCFYRRDVLAAVGGFDEQFGTAWREDADLFFTLVERGYRTERAESAVVVHPVRPAGWGVSLRQQRKSLWNALLYKKHPALYRQRIQPAPPWHYYAIVAALRGVLAGPGRGWRMLFGAVWALLSGRFCARRLRGTSRAPSHLAEMLVTSALIPPLSIFWRLRGAIRFRVWFL